MTKVQTLVGHIIGWLFALLVFAIGIINLFWGNDPGFGVFLILLSLVYVSPVNALFKELTGYKVHYIIKIILGLIILWAALGVGELFDKIALMLRDLS